MTVWHTFRGMTSMTVGHDPADESYLTSEEVCRILRISPRTLIRWDQMGRTQPLRLPNGYRRYRKSDIAALVAA